jgi:hypothetical protein
MNPLEVKAKLFSNMQQELAANQAQAQNTPEQVGLFANMQKEKALEAQRKGQLGALQHPFDVQNLPVEQKIKAQQLDTESQIAQIDRMINSAGVDQFGNQATPEQLTLWGKERERLIQQLAATPKYAQQLGLEKAKADEAAIRLQQTLASRDYATDTQAQVRREENARREAEAAAKAAKLKDVPANAVKVIVANDTALNKVNDALEGLKSRPESIGWKGYTPDEVLQRTDKEGVAVRALIADISSLKVHDRSGASVTASEFPRLKPFIPRVTDSYETAITKLNQFKQELENLTNSYKSVYSEEQGYRPLPALSSESTRTKQAETPQKPSVSNW